MINRNRLKKTGIFLLIVTLTVTCLTGCGKKESKDDGKVLAGLKEALENKNEPLTPSPGDHANNSEKSDNGPLTPSPRDHFLLDSKKCVCYIIQGRFAAVPKTVSAHRRVIEHLLCLPRNVQI